MSVTVSIALKHLLFRKRQSLVSLSGIVLGTAFFLAVSSMMRGSENDFIKRLVDNSPHITVSDEFREGQLQPSNRVYPEGAIEIRSLKEPTEPRGIRSYERVLASLREDPQVTAAAVLSGQGIVSSAGKDYGITLYGMVPEEITDVSTIETFMKQGSVKELIGNPDGIIIGSELARKLTLFIGDNLRVTSSTGQNRGFKILGIFRTGRNDYDTKQTFITLKRVQALVDRPNRANTIIIKLGNPYNARDVAGDIERRIGYKTVSWQEQSEDLLNTLAIRNAIMYSVVSAVLLVAAFGIYNVISTVVLEKQRDISILKSMGFFASEIRSIFLIQGIILGSVGSVLGLPLGSLMMYGLMQIKLKPPGAGQMINMPIDWGIDQFLIAAAFALTAAIVAAILPARKAAKLQPVDVLRGGF